MSVGDEDDEEDACSIEDTKFDYHDHMALAAKAFQKNKGNNFKHHYNPRPTRQRTRTCYNCGNVNHFIAECPFERKEDHNGKLVRKDKTKYIPMKTTPNKKSYKVLVAHEVQEEYMSSDEDEDEVVGVARVAIATSSSSPSSLFDSPNDDTPSAPDRKSVV